MFDFMSNFEYKVFKNLTKLINQIKIDKEVSRIVADDNRKVPHESESPGSIEQWC